MKLFSKKELGLIYRNRALTSSEISDILYENTGYRRDLGTIRDKRRKKGWSDGKRKNIFKKGHKLREKPNGTVIVRHGFLHVKIEGKFILQHRYLFEQRTGKKIPKNHVVLFRDGDPNNIEQENLLCVSRTELNILTKDLNYRNLSPSLRPLAESVALNRKIILSLIRKT